MRQHSLSVHPGTNTRAHARVGSIACLLAISGLAGFTAPASAAFTAPSDLASSAGNPQVATDPNGDSAFAWEFGFGRVQMRTMTDAGVLGAVQELGSASGTEDFAPRVVIDSQGDSVFAWVRQSPSTAEGVLARRSSAGSNSLGALIGVTPPGLRTSAPEIATDSNGDTIFTWVAFEGSGARRVQARTMTARGALGPIRNVSPLDGSSPQVATDAAGDSVLTWVREDNIDGDGDVVQARTMTVNGSLGPIVGLSAAAGRAFSPEVATDSDGDTIFTWLRYDGVRDRVQARQMTAGGVLGSTVTLTGNGPSAISPEVATDATGDSLIAWERSDASFDRIQARTMSAAAALGPVTNLSLTGGEAFAPQVASAASGASAVTWVRFDGAVDRIQARTMTAAGAFGGIADLSLAGADATAPQIAMASTSGDIVVTWERAGVAQFSRGP